MTTAVLVWMFSHCHCCASRTHASTRNVLRVWDPSCLARSTLALSHGMSILTTFKGPHCVARATAMALVTYSGLITARGLCHVSFNVPERQSRARPCPLLSWTGLLTSHSAIALASAVETHSYVPCVKVTHALATHGKQVLQYP